MLAHSLYGGVGCACSNDDEDGGNGGSVVSIKNPSTGVDDTYYTIRAKYTDYSTSKFAPSNEIIFSAAFSEDKDELQGDYFQFLIEQYKDSENSQIKSFKSFSDLKVGSYLIISPRRLFYYSEFFSGDELLHGASPPPMKL